MAKTPAAKAEAPALPDLESISSVKLDELPAATKASPLTDAESALAVAIIDGGSNGNAAVGPKLADRKEATAAAARVRRLVNRYIAAQGKPVAERPTLATRIVPKDGGAAWAITLSPPVTVVETAAEATDDENAITAGAAE
jgi:hypothetical protein